MYSVCLSVRPPAWNSSAPTESIFMQFLYCICVFFENQTIKCKFHYNRTRTKGTLHEDQYTFFIISRSVLRRIIKFSDKRCREKRATHFMFKKFFSENNTVYERTWKNIVEPDRPEMTTWRKRIACSIPKATDKHSEYVILIDFPQQQWLYEGASGLRYTCIACLVYPTIQPSFTEILKYNHKNKTFKYLFYRNLSIPISQIIIFCICDYLSKQILNQQVSPLSYFKIKSSTIPSQRDFICLSPQQAN